jgi:hypothetical protein
LLLTVSPTAQFVYGKAFSENDFCFRLHFFEIPASKTEEGERKNLNDFLTLLSACSRLPRAIAKRTENRHATFPLTKLKVHA